MEMHIEPGVLGPALTWVARSIPARSLVPALSGILCEVESGRLSLSTYDYTMSSAISVDVSEGKPGRALLPGRVLVNVARALPDAPLHMEVDAVRAVLRCGPVRFTLAAMPIDDYPAVPPTPSPLGTVDAAIWSAALQRVAFAANREDTLPVLAGVFLEFGHEVLTVTATDRYRLATMELPWRPRDATPRPGVLVPARALADAAKSLADTTDVEICVDDARGGVLGLAGGGRVATVRMLDSDYPSYESIFPKTASATARVKLDALHAAIKRAALVVERQGPVLLDLRDGRIVVTAGVGEENAAEEDVPAIVDDPGMRAAFNGESLMSGLSSLASEWVALSLTGSKLVLRPVTAAGDSTGNAQRYLMQSMRVPHPLGEAL